MKKLNYNKLIASNPTVYKAFTNELGQLVTLAEHPNLGEDYPVIAIFYKEKMAVCTDFFDCADMYRGSDYCPIFVDGEVICSFELN